MSLMERSSRGRSAQGLNGTMATTLEDDKVLMA
uniref:Uncharacterized protein n=1 Tax=Arundo donax TaxID=35708 RepID=A0A0A9AF71_ARUDO